MKLPLILLLSLSLSLAGRASSADLATLGWEDEACKSEIQYDPTKIDEESLRNTVNLLFSGRGISAPGLPNVSRPEQLALVNPRDYQEACARAVRQMNALHFIDLPGIEVYREAKVEQMNDECGFGVALSQAAMGNPTALNAYQPAAAQCSRYVEALEGKTDIRALWREIVTTQCATNAKPEACKAWDLADEGKSDGVERIRLRVLTFGWQNCAAKYLRTNTVKMDPLRTVLNVEFKELFKVKEIKCNHNNMQ